MKVGRSKLKTDVRAGSFGLMHLVCEIWNGDAIVRVMGSPQIQQLLYFENVPDNLLEKIKKRRSAEGSTSTRSCYSGCPSAAESGTVNSGTFETVRDVELSEIKQKFHVFTLKEAEDLGLIFNKSKEPSKWEQWRKWVIDQLNKYLVKYWREQRGRFSRTHDGDGGEAGDKNVMHVQSKYDAPNISMNLSVLKKPWELYLAAAVGVLSQAAVIVVATYAAYTPHLQFNKTGLTVQKYSYRQSQNRLPINRDAEMLIQL